VTVLDTNLKEPGHVPVLPPRIKPAAPRVSPDALEQFRGVPVPDIADLVGPIYTLDGGIGPIYEPIAPMVGQALTVKAVPGDNLAIHGAFALVQPNDILVIDWRGGTDYCGSGAESLTQPREIGLTGVVIDGGWRDAADLKERRFPLFARSRSASSPPKRRPGEINVPVACGGVVVEPGDIVIGDSEGVVVVPAWGIERVLAALSRTPTLTGASAVEKRRAANEQKYAWFRHRVEALGGSIES